MKINMSKVLVGGIIAGIVMLVVDFLSQKFWLGPQATAEMEAFKPGLGASMTQGNGMIMYLVFDIVMGILLVWLYAAMRPRFGPGPRTAFYSALAVWVASSIAYYGYMQMGMMSSGLWWSFGLVGLVACTLSAMAGAKFYSEDAVA